MKTRKTFEQLNAELALAAAERLMAYLLWADSTVAFTDPAEVAEHNRRVDTTAQTIIVAINGR